MIEMNESLNERLISSQKGTGSEKKSEKKDDKKDENVAMCPLCNKPLKKKVVEKQGGKLRQVWYSCDDCNLKGYIYSSREENDIPKKHNCPIPWLFI